MEVEGVEAMDQLISGLPAVLVHFTHRWCSTCIQTSKVLEEASALLALQAAWLLPPTTTRASLSYFATTPMWHLS